LSGEKASKPKNCALNWAEFFDAPFAALWHDEIDRSRLRMNEADTCRKFVVPKLQAAGWDNRPHAINEQRTFTDGRVVFICGKARRGKQKRSDYLLRYNPDFPIAVVEAKSRYQKPTFGSAFPSRPRGKPI
jgi:type I site-specific restriction endonuclease